MEKIRRSPPFAVGGVQMSANRRNTSMQINRTNKRGKADTPESRYCAAVRVFDEKIYGELNDRQREAVYCVNGPLLV